MYFCLRNQKAEQTFLTTLVFDIYAGMSHNLAVFNCIQTDLLHASYVHQLLQCKTKKKKGMQVNVSMHGHLHFCEFQLQYCSMNCLGSSIDQDARSKVL